MLISSRTIHGQTHSFSGTIGKYPIYLQLSFKGAHVDGYYFYKNKLIDISLTGTTKDGLITMNSSKDFEEDESNREIFKFKWPSKTIEGSWTKNGKSLTLKLYQLSPKETSNPKCLNTHLVNSFGKLSELTKVKIGLFKLKEIDSIQVINGIKIRYFEEILTGIQLFRIDSGMTESKQKDANLFLESLQIAEFLDGLDCASYSSYGMDYDYTFYDINLSTDFISYAVFTSYYCGGAHPSEANYGINYNLNSKKKIKVTDYLNPNQEADFNKRIYTYLAKIEPSYFDENNQLDEMGMECQYFKKELWTTECEFVFTAKGIKLLPSFSHYNAPCMDPQWAVIPYSEVKDLIKPEYWKALNGWKP
ncbi:hypothetical protein [Fluviicola taffensis]|uniref:DUF3298 domain-containing protein n=1 Tax=Fluviicola taffensis (strain DSM 16823 / NCIMB 13979 / RW262) TaxID=755732 RepID=F2IDY5_FLUTR|nr:hypothetical protein [Fluviicola taffensis]AEA45549.1 hypothetical protein Fluta_3580 [Fluviicola taffensis DSM 16823]